MGKRWIILSLLFLARTAMGLQFQSIGSSAPELVRDLGLSYAQIGSLIGLYMLPGVFISLPGGMLGKRFGDQKICYARLALMVLGGCLVAFSSGYGVAFAGRLISGVGSILFNLVLTKMATDWFAENGLVLAMGILMASWPFGIAIGLVALGPMAALLGWASVMFLTAGLSGVSLLLILALYEPAPAVKASAAKGAGQHQASLSLLPLGEALPAMVAGAIWGTFNLGLVVFFSFVPLLLSESGMAPSTAAAQASIALWICAVSVPLGGLFVQRLGHASLSIAMFSALCGAMLLLLPSGLAPAVLCAVLGLSVGPPPGAIMALPARVLSVPNRATGLGVFYTCNYTISSLGPMAAGLLHDAWKSAVAPVYFGAACFLVIVPLLLAFLLLEARQKRVVSTIPASG